MAITIKNLDKYYGPNRGVVNLNLQVEEGELFGFIGPNGAGKSTTIRILLDLIKPTRGQAMIFDMDCSRESVRIKMDIGYVPSEVNYYPDLTARQILEYAAKLRLVDQANSRIPELMESLDINPRQRMGDLSLGNKKKVAIAQALLGSPKLLIMDEPTNGLDPLLQNRLEELLLNEHQKGTTVFLSSHNLQEVQRLCSQVAIIKEGSIVEVRSMTAMLSQAVRRIRITGEGLTWEMLTELNPQILEADEQGITFNYQGEVNHLMKVLAELNLQDISIGEPTLEDMFMKYYSAERTGL